MGITPVSNNFKIHQNLFSKNKNKIEKMKITRLAGEGGKWVKWKVG
jgi:hypothetical protein